MPKADRDEIIELTEIVEEGHPETPNLSPAASTPATREDTLDDLDLEKEIDQIFADLAPSSPGDRSKGERESVESDMLDLDELFADQEGPQAVDRVGVPERGTEHAPEHAANPDDAQISDVDDDFEKLFAQVDERQQTETETLTDAQAEPEGLSEPSSEETDWPTGIENGARDDSAWGDAEALETEAASDPFAGESPEETTEQDAPGDSAVADGQSSREQAAQEQPAVDGLPDREFSPDFPTPESEETAGLGADWGAGETTSSRDDTRDELEPPLASGTERVDQAFPPDVLLERLQAMEARLAGLEQRDVFQPDMDILPALVDERINARIGEMLPGSRDHAKQDEATISEVNVQIQQALEGMTGQIEIMVAKAVENKYTAFAEAVTDEVERRFEQFLEARLDQHLDRLFDQHKARILEEVWQNEAPEASVLNQAGEVRGDEHADATRIAELAAGLDDLRDEVRAEGRDREQNTTSLLQDQEGRIIETVRQEIQALRTDWDERMDTLATDVKRSSSDLAEQQARVESLQGEWQAWQLAQDQGLADDEAQELGDSSDPLRDERLAEFIESRLEAMRAEVMDEMRRAVPLAAAQIIREEIQALAQEED